MSPTNANLAYAINLVHATCCLAGSASYLDDVRRELRSDGAARAIRRSPKEIGFGIAVAANLAAKKDREGTTGRRNSGYLRAGQAVQELPRNFSETDRRWGMRDIPLGRSG